MCFSCNVSDKPYATLLSTLKMKHVSVSSSIWIGLAKDGLPWLPWQHFSDNNVIMTDAKIWVTSIGSKRYWIQIFHFPNSVVLPRLKSPVCPTIYPLLEGRDEFIPFSKTLA